MEVSDARCVVHLDMDCFYAQVEQQRSGVGAHVPLGVRQKRLLVTCNYAARARGVPKYCPLQQALRACPELLVRCGEDLAPYRRASSQILQLLNDWRAPKQRLGLDEIFLDVTELVPQVTDDEPPPCGCDAGTHQRLQIAARLAEDMRTKIKAETGMTCCAGIAHNKILAKLGGALHKPDQQTVVYPCEAFALMSSFSSVKAIPGVGTKTLEILTDLKILSVIDLQNAQMSILEHHLGSDFAKKLKNLSHGIDPSPVKADEPPTAIGVEDSYKDLNDPIEVKRQLEILLNRLVPLVHEAGRSPKGLKLTALTCGQTIRRARQCDISPSLFKMESGNLHLSEGARSEILSVAWNLFRKLIEGAKTFHVAVLGLAFTKLHELKTGKSSVKNYFSNNFNRKRTHDSEIVVDNKEPAESERLIPANKKLRQINPAVDENLIQFRNEKRTEYIDDNGNSLKNNFRPDDKAECSSKPVLPESADRLKLPPDVDETTFMELPEDLRKELILSWKTPTSPPLMKVSNKSVKNKKPNTLLKYFTGE